MAPRLSVSALRDYTFCGEYYRLKRVAKVRPTAPDAHQRVAGQLVHSAFYYAYGDPVGEEYAPGRRRVTWSVNGRFDPARAKAMFWHLWNRDDTGLDDEGAEHYSLLKESLPPWRHVHFGRGLTKALKAEDPNELRRGWGEHYADMLSTALDTPLPGQLVEIERKVEYEVGGVQMLGFIDLVMVGQTPGTEDYADLKSGYNKPSEEKLPFDVQMQLYYLTGPDRIFLWHMRSGLYLVPRNIPLISGLERSVPMTAEAVEAGFFRPRCDSECAACEFRAACLPEGTP